MARFAPVLRVCRCGEMAGAATLLDKLWAFVRSGKWNGPAGTASPPNSTGGSAETPVSVPIAVMHGCRAHSFIHLLEEEAVRSLQRSPGWEAGPQG